VDPRLGQGDREAGKGSVFGARLDLDEADGAVVDLMIARYAKAAASR